MDDVEAGKAFFDFRVADIAMGSGHFLVAAVDRIERRLQQYLAERPLPAVIDEIARLRQSAVNALGVLADGIDIEDTTLLRRQIARRCVYGVDLNPIAVELARVSIWIHTFVPGLPLSMLDHHLVQGNSLVGIGTMEEARELVTKATGGFELFNVIGEKIMGSAAESMTKVGELADADNAEIHAARGALQEARLDIDPLKAMFDILAVSRMDTNIAKKVNDYVYGWQDKPEEIRGSILYRSTVEVMAGIEPFHFPVAFPDVFARSQPGFDVILGNPPWKKLKAEEDLFWRRFYPGFMGLPQREREELTPQFHGQRPDLSALLENEKSANLLLRAVLVSGPYPGIGKGDPDPYKAFAWRFWHLAQANGRLGIVFPRSIWNSLGSAEFRKTVFHNASLEDLTFLVNKRNWVFEDTSPKSIIALSSIRKSRSNDVSIKIRGPYSSKESYDRDIKPSYFITSGPEISASSPTALIPLLPTVASGEVFQQMRQAPSLDNNSNTSWRLVPHRELDSTNDKKLMTFSKEPLPEHWPVYGGKSFDIWDSDRGQNRYFAWVNPDNILDHLQVKRVRSASNKNSAFSDFPKEMIQVPDTLPCLHPRIVMRKISRGTDPRTIIAALVPPKVVLHDGAPYLLRTVGTPGNEAFVLGVLCSIPLDWYARTIIEMNVSHQFINRFPIPSPSEDHLLYRRVVSLSGRLASPDERFADWAKAVGVEYGPLEPAEKEDMIHELDAAVAHLYRLSEQQLRHIFETFHVGWDYEDRLEATIRHYRRLENSI